MYLKNTRWTSHSNLSKVFGMYVNVSCFFVLLLQKYCCSHTFVFTVNNSARRLTWNALLKWLQSTFWYLSFRLWPFPYAVIIWSIHLFKFRFFTKASSYILKTRQSVGDQNSTELSCASCFLVFIQSSGWNFTILT